MFALRMIMRVTGSRGGAGTPPTRWACTGGCADVEKREMVSALRSALQAAMTISDTRKTRFNMPSWTRLSPEKKLTSETQSDDHGPHHERRTRNGDAIRAADHRLNGTPQCKYRVRRDAEQQQCADDHDSRNRRENKDEDREVQLPAIDRE